MQGNMYLPRTVMTPTSCHLNLRRGCCWNVKNLFFFFFEKTKINASKKDKENENKSKNQKKIKERKKRQRGLQGVFFLPETAQKKFFFF